MATTGCARRTTSSRTQSCPASSWRCGRSWSCVLRLGVRRGALELDADERLVADHPGVVSSGDAVGVAGTQVGLGAVGVRDTDATGDDVAQVLGLARVGADHGLDALRPAP